MNAQSTPAPLWAMTQQEFTTMISTIIKKEVTEALKEQEKTEHPTYIRGNKALAQFLGCGTTKIHRLLTSGVLNDAMTRSERTIIYDTNKVLECIKNNKK